MWMVGASKENAVSAEIHVYHENWNPHENWAKYHTCPRHYGLAKWCVFNIELNMRLLEHMHLEQIC